MRKLCTVRKVVGIKPIDGADLIEATQVDNWWCVTKKGEFTVGQEAIFFEIDSWVPHEIAPFLSKGQDPREFLGIKGERLKTIKLRKQISQGLLLPLSHFDVDWATIDRENLDELFNIELYEREDASTAGGVPRGNFPYFIPKTEQPRIQNLSGSFLQSIQNETFEVTIKLDGSSVTMYQLPPNSKYIKQVSKDGELNPEIQSGTFGVCSKNIDLRRTEGNAFWDIATKVEMESKLKEFAGGRALAIQGELIAPNIQKNYEKVAHPQFYVYAMWDIDLQTYLTPKDASALCKLMGINYVPILHADLDLSQFGSISDIIAYADGAGMNPNVKREGLVYKSNQTTTTFKSISDSYLLYKEKSGD